VQSHPPPAGYWSSALRAARHRPEGRCHRRRAALRAV